MLRKAISLDDTAYIDISGMRILEIFSMILWGNLINKFPIVHKLLKHCEEVSTTPTYLEYEIASRIN